MKRIIPLLLSLLVITTISCRKDEPLMESAELEDAEILYSGTFKDAAHETSGKVKVEQDANKTILSFEEFETDNGPDLFVYLSTDKSDDDFINLGELKGTSGDFYYELDASTDFQQYDHVLIWCKRFSVLFGSAELQ